MGERLQLATQADPGRVAPARDVAGTEHPGLEQLAVLAVDDTLVDPDRRAVLDLADVVGTRLEQQHAGVREELGPSVG